MMLMKTIATLEHNARAGGTGAVYARALEQHQDLAQDAGIFWRRHDRARAARRDPYESAIGDAAVVFEDGAMVMRPSAMSRRAEADRFESECSRLDVPIAGTIAAPGLLDGGDVLLVGRTAFLGRSTRGNAIGRAGFTAVARAHGFDVIEVALASDVVSLRSVASAVARDTVVISPDKVDAEAFAGFKRSNSSSARNTPRVWFA